jgi:hypothetical protein
VTNCAFPASVSLIEAINKNPLDSRQMLCAKYERGLKYLIQRICPAFMEECFSATIEEAMAAVQTERVLTEEALQSFICQTARQIAATFPSISIAEKDPLFNLQVILAMRRKLTVFSSDQREALRRYYVNKESPASICAALGLAIEEFGSIRRIARDALEFKFNELRQPVSSPTQSEAVGRRGVTSVMKTKWKMRATA